MKIDDLLHKNILIAGQTGSGKSNFIVKLITTFIKGSNPDDFRLILIDPKRVQLCIYDGLPHLLFKVVYESEKAKSILKWVWEESLRRINAIERAQILNKLPKILIIIDEAADLMVFDKEFFEDYVKKITSLSDETGINLIFSTVRPSSEFVVTERIRECFLNRIAFKLANKDDSILIIGERGAEKIINPGSCLIKNLINQKAESFQMPFVSEDEEKRTISDVKEKYCI